MRQESARYGPRHLLSLRWSKRVVNCLGGERAFTVIDEVWMVSVGPQLRRSSISKETDFEFSIKDDAAICARSD